MASLLHIIERSSFNVQEIYRYEEAAHAATRALTMDPKSTEARYVRGVARMEQRLLKPAQTGVVVQLSYVPSALTLPKILKPCWNTNQHTFALVQPSSKSNNSSPVAHILVPMIWALALWKSQHRSSTSAFPAMITRLSRSLPCPILAIASM